MEYNAIALKQKITDVIEEYNDKMSKIEETLHDYEMAGEKLKMMSCVSGTWGNTTIDTGRVYDRHISDSLLKSAWRHIYDGLQIDSIASAKDKKRFEMAMSNPPEFTIENIRSTFGDYVADPYGNILRGLAEVFCDLDPAYKSHSKVKIGVDGLPKRVILSGFNSYSSWGQDRLRDIINALASYQGKPMADYHELSTLIKTGDSGMKEYTATTYKNEEKTYPKRGLWLKKYKNGNGHVYFDEETLRDINMALAKYYGEALYFDDENYQPEKGESTAVSKDLQYYPTPKTVVDSIVRDIYCKGKSFLEPSCGTGEFMDALREEGAEKILGIEVDITRANIARDKGHSVINANFLEMEPTQKFDMVVMNPPFNGTHYFKHVKHALKFLKEDGVLKAILPVTARYDHGLIETLKVGCHRLDWYDLPVGSFRDSGTNVNTTVLTIMV